MVFEFIKNKAILFEKLAFNITIEEAAEILEVPLGIDDESLKKAYKKKVMEFHPDLNKEDTTYEMQRINRAYEVIKNNQGYIFWDEEDSGPKPDSENEDSDSYEEFDRWLDEQPIYDSADWGKEQV